MMDAAGGGPPDPIPVTRESMFSLLGFHVSDVGLYAAAFRHRSASGPGLPSYERLEFLGDSVVSLVCSRWLYCNFSEADEGDLTKIRTRMVGGQALSRVAAHLGLHRFVQTSEKGRRSGWHLSPRIAEDVFEALAGAIYLSEGQVAARDFILKSMSAVLDWQSLLVDTNFKDQLVRLTQSVKSPAPVYTTVGSPDGGGGGFTMSVEARGVCAFGEGATKKAAEQCAARNALQLLAGR